MKIDAVEVTTGEMKRTVAFYSLLGFEFSEFKEDEDHLEPKTPDGSARLMIDTKKMMTEMLGTPPKPGNHGSFAIQYGSPAEIDRVAKKVKEGGFKLVKEPWDAFWGQRYAVVQDPDGYQIDLYAQL
jgi:catechol 2,3-dioxygenase-like lactoylglutathione lyase family enzyme